MEEYVMIHGFLRQLAAKTLKEPSGNTAGDIINILHRKLILELGNTGYRADQ